jgi:hypothetical protein
MAFMVRGRTISGYKGSGSIDEAANFTCVAPARALSSRP